MIFKLFVISYLVFSSVLLAQSEEDPNCNKSALSNDLEALAKSLQIPNCNTKKNIKAANNGNFEELCKECIPKFNASLKINSEIKSDSIKLNLKKVILDEFKRNLSSSLLDLVSLRSLHTTTADFSEAISACNLEAFENKLKKQECSKGFSLKELKTQAAEELGNLLSMPPVTNDKGLLNRSSAKDLCGISDVSILRAKSLSLEQALNADLIEKISKIKAEDPISLKQAIESISANFPLNSALTSHPILGQMLSSPQTFISFFQSLSKPYSLEKLQASLYADKKNNSLLIKGIAKKCSDTFAAFEKLACNQDIQKGKVKLNKLKATESFLQLANPSKEEFIDLSSQEDLNQNERLKSICEIRSDSKDSFDLESGIDSISGWMPQELSKIPYEVFREEKYVQDVRNTKKNLCEIQAGKKPCEEGTYQCNLFKSLTNQSDPKTPEGRLAKSSDTAVNSLLRSFIGVPDGISPSTRTTLINEGILPKNPQGDLVPQPQVPERQPEYLNKMTEIAKTNVAPTTTPPKTASTPKTTTTQPQAPAKVAPSTTASTATQTTAPSSTTTPSKPTEDPDMSSFNDEILRRLSQKNTDPKKPVTKEESRKAVSEYFKEKGRTVPLPQQHAMADQITDTYNSPPAPTISQADKATLPKGESAKEKREKEQKLAALSGMQGAQASAEATAGRTPASETDSNDGQNKKLSTVALNITEDKVKLNLSDVLNEKLVKNDSEGQLLKVFLNNKNDFILQVNGTSFKVKYNPASKNYSVSYDSGDTKEASRLKPQLEKFFHRITTNVVSLN